MLRAAGAVIVGYVVWTVIWVGVHFSLFRAAGEVAARNERIADNVALIGMLVLGFVCSVAGGFTCSKISRASRPSAAVLALLFLLTGLGVQISAWPVFPLWYHVIFLISVPVVTFVVATRSSPAASQPRYA
ncbi:MAG: hypothetical protein SFY96_04505 [Planctomycetota bacterium]|nr:hypothetical protein [Planctomycetota bacterium]